MCYLREGLSAWDRSPCGAPPQGGWRWNVFGARGGVCYSICKLERARTREHELPSPHPLPHPLHADAHEHTHTVTHTHTHSHTHTHTTTATTPEQLQEGDVQQDVDHHVQYWDERGPRAVRVAALQHPGACACIECHGVYWGSEGRAAYIHNDIILIYLCIRCTHRVTALQHPGACADVSMMCRHEDDVQT